MPRCSAAGIVPDRRLWETHRSTNLAGHEARFVGKVPDRSFPDRCRVVMFLSELKRQAGREPWTLNWVVVPDSENCLSSAGGNSVFRHESPPLRPSSTRLSRDVAWHMALVGREPSRQLEAAAKV